MPLDEEWKELEINDKQIKRREIKNWIMIV